MGNILVFLPHAAGNVTKQGRIALQVAQELKSSWQQLGIVGVLLGAGAKDAANASATKLPLDQIIFSEHEELSSFRPMQFASALLQCGAEVGADVFVGIASSVGKDIFPIVAAKLDAGQASDIVAVNADGTLRRPMFAGDVLADVRVETAKKVVTVRASAFQPVEEVSGSSTQVKEATLSLSGYPVKVISTEVAKNARPELGDAEIVVSGGRALGSGENFEKIIFPLADALGAAVGASRAAVDSGYAPNDWQVGQTGKVVAPNLYIAVGISGAIQHLAGMKDSKVIVAINKDPDAPIFEVADFGLVADLFSVAPELTEAVKSRRG